MLGSDFQRRSSLRRVFLSSLRAGVNQGFDLEECISLVITGACLSRIAVRVVL